MRYFFFALIYYFLILSLCIFVFFFFFKQKTAYEMRISDWSSDVCSSDLRPTLWPDATPRRNHRDCRSTPVWRGESDDHGSCDRRGCQTLHHRSPDRRAATPASVAVARTRTGDRKSDV